MSANSNTYTIWWLLAITTVGGLLVTRAQPAAEPEPAPILTSEPEKQETDPAKGASARVLEPFRHFAGGEPASLPSDAHVALKPSLPDQWCESADSSFEAWQPFSKMLEPCVGKVDSLILTVADPKDTRTNYRFDMHIDALHKAVQADNFTLDNYYLPWQASDRQLRHRDEPGLILYRKKYADSDLCHLLAVFVVGETQTSGVHKASLAKAVAYIANIDRGFSNAKREVYVAGPIFSGSADALAIALKSAGATHRVHFTVITGSANYLDAKRFKGLTGQNAELHTTISKGSELKAALIKYVEDREGVSNLPIAWLTEFNTGVGASSLSTGNGGRGKASGNTAAAAAGATQASASRSQLHEFIFPANIASLRDAVEKDNHAKAQALDLPGAGHRLVIPSSEAATAIDSPRSETPQLTAPTVEILIGQILSTIQQRQIRYVGISATDARDPVFFAELIRTHCPGVQILLVSPDVIHLHSNYRRTLQGALVASSHCLTPDEQNWCFPYGYIDEGRNRYTLFSSQSNLGIYNALIFIRGLQSNVFEQKAEKISLSESCTTPGRLLPLAYGLPLESGPSRPPIWISRVGNSAFVPITTQRSKTSELLDATALGVKRVPSFESRLSPACRLMACLWLIGAAIFVFVTVRDTAGWSLPLSGSDDWPSNYVVFAYVCRAIIGGTLAFMLSFFCLMAIAPMEIAASLGGRSDWFDSAILCGTALAVVVLALMFCRDILGAMIDAFRLGRELRRSPPEGRALKTSLLVAQITAVLVLLLLSGLGIWTVVDQVRAFEDRAFYLLWFTATNDLSAGASMLPAAQSLALVTVLLGYGLLHQIYSLRRERVIPPPRLGREQYTPEEINATRAYLLFPLLCHYFVRSETPNARVFGNPAKPDFVSISFLLAIVAWCVYGLNQTPPSDYFNTPASLVYVIFFSLTAYWFVRVLKLQKLTGMLEKVTASAARSVDWDHAFKSNHVTLSGLQDLLWPTTRPSADDPMRTTRLKKLQAAEPYFRDGAEFSLNAVEMQMFIRQVCLHINRLITGLVVSAVLLFVAAQSHPLYLHPFLRLTASFVLCTIGVSMIWFYVRVDRNPVVSALVGSRPNEVEFNWTLVRTVVPAMLLAFAALLSQTFPDATHWLMQSLEPLRGK